MNSAHLYQRVVIGILLLSGATSPQGQGPSARNPSTGGYIGPLRVPGFDPLPDPPLTNQSSIEITGRAFGASLVEVSSPLGVFNVPVTKQEFTADVPLKSNQVNAIYFTSVDAQLNRSAPKSAFVTHDTQPPDLFIDFPADGSTITTAKTDVAGRVGDTLSGFMDLEVIVNGQMAEVDVGIGTNGTFFAGNVVLVPGQANVISATATDFLGNQVTKQITVNHVVVPQGAPQMMIASGNQQTGPILTDLPQPIVVHAFSYTTGKIRQIGQPSQNLANKIVNFQVTRSDGLLSATSGGTKTNFLQVRTDAQGLARAYWTLGSDAGCGNNRVTVTSNGIAGTVAFCASATAGMATRIAIGSGNNQVAETGGPAPMPLRVFVHDSQNPVAGVPVMFSVLEGGGKVNGTDLALRPTDGTGHADVDFELGPQEGPNRIQATFMGNPNQPVTFLITGEKRVQGQETTFVGVVLDNSAQPIQGAEVELTIGQTALPPVTSGLLGAFAIEDITLSGAARLHVDGATAFHLGGAEGDDVPLGSFPSLEFQVVVVPETENTLPMPVLLPPLDPLNVQAFNATLDVELTIRTLDENQVVVPLVDGLKFIVDKDTTVTLANGTKIGPSDPGSVILALNEVHFDEIPMPMPDGASPPFAWTLKPTGATFDPPIRIEMPNMAGLPAGSAMYFLNFDHDTNRFEIVASGQVSPDGHMMISDPGDGIDKAGWGGFCPPYPNRGSAGGGPPPGNPPPDPDEEKPCEPPAKPGDSEEECCDEGVGDPIYLFNGEFYEEVEDLRILGRGMDFVWARKYRGKTGPNTSQGNGWDCSYNIFIAQQGQDIVLCDGNTRADVYVLQSNGKWVKGGYFRELSFDQPNNKYVLLFEDKGAWNFFPFDGSPTAGKISSIVDRNGNAISFAYNATTGRLETITDTLGRNIGVFYNPDGFVDHVQDFAGRQVVYQYYAAGIMGDGGDFGDLKSVRSPIVTGTPNFNDFPQGKTVTYTYSEGFADVRLNHNLLTITDAKGQLYLQNEYATTTNPSDLEFDRIVRQTWGNPNETIEIVYVAQTPSQANGFAIVKAIVNDRVGNVKEYFYSNYNVCVNMREYTGRWPANQFTADADLATGPTIPKLRSTDPAFFETKQEWNTDRRLTCVQEPDGSQTFNVYEGDLNPKADPRARGNRRARVQVAGKIQAPANQATLTEIFEYDQNLGGGCCGFNFVTKHIDARGNVTLNEYDAAGNRTKTTHRIPSIVEEFGYNQFGQMTSHKWPDNGSSHKRFDVYAYYTSGPQMGYLQSEVVDSGSFNLTTTYEYDSVGNLVRMIDPRGNDTLYAVNALNQVVRETSRSVETSPGSGTFVEYEKDYFYDANDNLVRVDVENVDEKGIPDANAYVTTLYDYEILNRQIRKCEEAGDYDVPRGTSPVLDCSGLPQSEFVTTEYEYDANRNRTQARYGEAVEGRQPRNTETTLYDERDLVFQRIRAPGTPGPGEPSQSTTQYDYDSKGNLVTVREGQESSPRITIYAYDGYDRRVTETDPMGNVTTYTHDANDNLVKIRKDGQLVDVVGSTGNVRLSEMTFVYDAMDRRIREETSFFDTNTQNPIQGGQQLGKSIMTTEYNDISQVTRVVNDNDSPLVRHDRKTFYDDANRVAIEEDAKGNTWTYGYDANSNRTSVLETAKSDIGGPDERFTTTMVYDALDRLVQTIDNVGNTTTFQYDSRDNLVLSRDALAHEIRYHYDGLDRQVRTVRDMDDDGPALNGLPGDGNPDIVTAQAWDDTSRLIGQTDDNGNTTSYAYDPLDRLIVTQTADGTLYQVGTGAVWPLGNPTPSLTGFTNDYDVHGNQVKRTDANGSIVVSTYDLLNRVTAKNITVGPGVSNDTTFENYQYDGLSRLVRAEDNDSTVTRSYDSASNVTAETQDITTDALPTAVVASVYDGVGNQTRCTYPGGRVIATTFDALERKKTITDVTNSMSPQMIATYVYVGADRVVRRDYGNNTRCTYTYDGITGVPNPVGDFGVKRIIATEHVSNPGGSQVLLDSRTYRWDKLYNKTQRKDIRAGGPQLTHDYQYDFAYRLIHTTVTDAIAMVLRDTVYTLDGVGNRMQVVGEPDPGMYTLDATLPDPADYQVNQYTATSVDVRGYDQNGSLSSVNLGQQGQRLVSFDCWNRLVQYIDSSSGQRHAYGYDGLGRRIRKILDADGAAEESQYLYAHWNVIEEKDDTGNAEATYAYGLYVDELLNMQRTLGIFFYHADDLYNVVAVTSIGGVPAERYEYEDYGAVSFYDGTGLPIGMGGIGNAYLFTGSRMDAETGLYYYRTRYLDPGAGRFVTHDTVGTWGDYQSTGNGVAYVGNNPYTRLDPFGLGVGEGPPGGPCYSEEPECKYGDYHGHQKCTAADDCFALADKIADWAKEAYCREKILNKRWDEWSERKRRTHAEQLGNALGQMGRCAELFKRFCIDPYNRQPHPAPNHCPAPNAGHQLGGEGLLVGGGVLLYVIGKKVVGGIAAAAAFFFPPSLPVSGPVAGVCLGTP